MSQRDTDGLSQDVVFDLLSNRRRRFILSHLYEQGPTTLMTFAVEIAAWEEGIDIEDVTDSQRKRAYVSIYQTHVPKLEDSGVITYDSDSGLIELTERADDIIRYLPAGSADEPPWQFVYVAVAFAGLLVYLLGVFEVLPVTVSSLLVVLGVFCVAVVQYLYSHLKRGGPSPNLIVKHDETT